MFTIRWQDSEPTLHFLPIRASSTWATTRSTSTQAWRTRIYSATPGQGRLDKFCERARSDINSAKTKKESTIARDSFFVATKFVVGRAGFEPATNGLKVR